jgi:hypothetical protein
MEILPQIYKIRAPKKEEGDSGDNPSRRAPGGKA